MQPSQFYKKGRTSDAPTFRHVAGVTYEFLNLNGRVAHQFWTENGVEHRIDFIYDQQGKPLTLRYKAGSQSYTYYCLTNLQGDVLKLYHAKLVDGKLVTTEVASYTYDAWGNVTDINRTAADTKDIAHLNPIRYRGYYQDVETGFYYLESRYYDPAIGRFVNADSLAITGAGFLGFNMFAHCNNNPLKYLDPSGKMTVSWDAIVYYGSLHEAILHADDNCYMMATGSRDPNIPGYSGYTSKPNVHEIQVQITVQFTLKGFSVTDVTDKYPEYIPKENEYLIAFRVGTEPLPKESGNRNSQNSTSTYDYHFMRRMDNG